MFRICLIIRSTFSRQVTLSSNIRYRYQGILAVLFDCCRKPRQEYCIIPYLYRRYDVSLPFRWHIVDSNNCKWYIFQTDTVHSVIFFFFIFILFFLCCSLISPLFLVLRHIALLVASIVVARNWSIAWSFADEAWIV
jgi:hypothetical protein